MTTEREALAALSLALRQAARAYLGLREGEHWDSGIADAQARALAEALREAAANLPVDVASVTLRQPEALWNRRTTPPASPHVHRSGENHQS